MKTKIFLAFISWFVFCAFQYGISEGQAPFQNGWQAYIIGIVALATSLFALKDLLVLCKHGELCGF